MSANVETIRHSASHVMAEAVLKLYPGTKLGIGPAIDDGFYYDFQFPNPIQSEDLPAIEKEMRRIIASGAQFVRKEISKDEARALFADQPFKVELIDALEGTISTYEQDGFIDLCRGFGIKVFHHDDGAIRPIIPELITMGIDVLNPIQANCPGMEMEGLKRDFGKQLCFHGGIDNQDILPHGTPEQVRAEVRRAIDTLATDGTGYILAPCHNLQAVTPVENILAMYDEAWQYGKL